MSLEVVSESSLKICQDLLFRLVGFTFRELRIHPDSEINLLLVDKPAMARYKGRWLGEFRPTDVLSLPMDQMRPGSLESLSRGILGDVVICLPVAREQAAAANHLLEHEVLLLLLHSLLHLLGYDHAEAEDRQVMFARQKELLVGFFAQENLGNPGPNLVDFPDPDGRK